MTLLQHPSSVQADTNDTALMISRFQPLHLGHLDAIKQTFASGIRKVLIGIGSANKISTADNPFSAEDRKKMLMDVLSAEGLLDACSIYYLQDFGDNELWKRHIENGVDPFDHLVTDNETLFSIFPDKQQFVPTTNVHARGTIIRNAIFQANYQVLNKFLHPKTLHTLHEIEAFSKIRDIFGPEMMEPKNAVDVVIRNSLGQVLLIERKYFPHGFALPGGKMDYGEKAMQSALREACEELGGAYEDHKIVLDLPNKEAKRGGLHVKIKRALGYRDDPKRDPRRHMISFPFELEILSGEAIASDDATSQRRFDIEEIENLLQEQWAFPDHRDIILDAVNL